MSVSIPIIDIGGCGLHFEDISKINENHLKEISTGICKAFADIGFCYLKNHGIPDDQVNNLMKTSKEFFEQPVDVKQKYAKTDKIDDYHGWIAREQERLSPVKPPDFKEAYNYKPNTKHVETFPEFEQSLHEVFVECTKLSMRILDFMSIGLNLSDRNILHESHRLMGKPGNTTTLRTLYYPPVINAENKEGQMRCGEHSDYGSITLLFQGDKGLEVRNVDGNYVAAPKIPGTVLVNIGDLMQRWTADKLIATKHRILMPQDEDTRQKSRQSMALFVMPDDNALIKCLDNSNKYDPITTRGYLEPIFAKSMT